MPATVSSDKSEPPSLPTPTPQPTYDCTDFLRLKEGDASVARVIRPIVSIARADAIDVADQARRTNRPSGLAKLLWCKDAASGARVLPVGRSPVHSTHRLINAVQELVSLVSSLDQLIPAIDKFGLRSG